MNNKQKEIQIGGARIKQSNIQPISKKQTELIQQKDNFKKQSDLSNVTQNQIKQQLPIQLQDQIFSLTLPTSTYYLRYNQIGSQVLVASNHGHIFIIDLKSKQLVSENKIDDHIVDCCFLANQNLICIAYGQHISIYDSNLLLLHDWRSLKPIKIYYLQYHMILVIVSQKNIKYLDITNGKIVATVEPESQILSCCVNYDNALVGVATIQNQNTVQWFAPSQQLPVVAINCQMVIQKLLTWKNILIAYNEKQIGFFKLNQEIGLINSIQSLKTIKNIEISQTGVLAVIESGQQINSQYIAFYKINDLLQGTEKLQKYLYMKEQNQCQQCQFRPYYDNFCYTTITGFYQIFIPQSCIRQIDTFDSNVFQTHRQRGEQEIKQQLQKISWELIGNNYLLQTKKLTDEEKVNKKYNQLFKFMKGEQNNNSQKSNKVKQKINDQKNIARIIEKQELSKQKKEKKNWDNKFFGKQQGIRK